MKESLLDKLVDNKASKTVLTLLGVIAAAITIYAFLMDKSAELRYEIISNTNVLDFNADIGNLQVTYDSTDLKETNENLRIYTVKVISTGEKNILKEFYDSNDPLGLEIDLGRIIERPEIIQTSSVYLNRNVKIENYTSNRLTFSQVILEPGEFYVIKLLVIHKMDKIPKLASFGKIAGQKTISVVNFIDVKDEFSFLEKVYQGNFWVQLLRLLSYFVLVVIILIIIAVIAERIDSIGEKKRKRKMIMEFKKTESYIYTRMDDALFDRYQNHGASSFIQMQRLLIDEIELNQIYASLSDELRSKELKVDGKFLGNHRRDNWSLITEMTNDGMLFKENLKLTVNQPMAETLNKFIKFLRENKEFKKQKRML
jgi:hypothetical protein